MAYFRYFNVDGPYCSVNTNFFKHPESAREMHCHAFLLPIQAILQPVAGDLGSGQNYFGDFTTFSAMSFSLINTPTANTWPVKRQLLHVSLRALCGTGSFLGQRQ